MKRVRVLVVDDSATIRRLITDAIQATSDLEVVGTAPNGAVALQRLDLAPDVVTLDIEMPVMDGLSALRSLRVKHPRLPVLMFSSHTERGAIATLDALAAGASDFVAKPVVESPEQARAFMEREVVPRLRALTGRPGPRAAPAAPAAFAAAATALPRPSPGLRPAPRTSTAPLEVVLVAVSTGGPVALAQLVPALPADLAAPVLIVQHMPSLFTRILADRLASLSGVRVLEAADGLRPLPGHVYLAPGGQHLLVRRKAGEPVLYLDDGPPENSCRPSADPTFRSASEVWGPATLAVVMTGMGRDGCLGAQQVRARGGAVLAQDRETSVVWGMPGAVVEADLADEVLPLGRLAAAITERVAHGRARVHTAAAP